MREDHFRRPSPARLWNYLQGGRDNYAVDRDVGDAMAAAYPDMFRAAREVRRFHNRAVRYVAERGVRQFLDIGCGLPAPAGSWNTHEVAQAVDPSTRVVYCDNDQVVLAHAEAFLTSLLPDAGPVSYLDADIRDVDRILAEAAETLDFARPVGVLCFGVLGYIPDDGEARGIVAKLVGALVSGGYLLLEDGLDTDRAMVSACEAEVEREAPHYRPRTLKSYTEFLTGLELVDPGVVAVSMWRPGWSGATRPRWVAEYGGVAHKP